MKANAEKMYKEGFILDESNLRKINEIIDDRLPNSKKLFKINTNNSKSFECEDIEIVLNEDNDEYQAIERIYINVSNSTTQLTLGFRERGVILEVEGTDRDIVFLLYSDLDSYLRKEVANRNYIPGTNKGFFAQALVFFAFYATFIFTLMYFNVLGEEILKNNELSEVLNSDSTNLKLNYIIKELQTPSQERGTNSGFFILMLIPFSMAFFMLRALCYKYAYPFNIFLIGKKIKLYERYKNHTEKVIWGVCVSFVISLLSGFALK